MDDIYETIEYRGFNIQIKQDLDAAHPGDYDEMLCKIVQWSKYLVSNDKDLNFDDPKDVLEEMLCYLKIPFKRIYLYDLTFKELYNKYMYKIERKAIVLPIYMYDHSGVTIQTHPFPCPWDSGLIGYAYVSKDRIREMYGWGVINKRRKEKIERIIKSEIETIDHYLVGAVFGYTIEPKDTNKKIECEDTCWGYYGYDFEKSGLLSDAKIAINHCIKEYKEEVMQEFNKRKRADEFIKKHWAY